jgi:serine/threonine protein kinase
MGQNPANMNAMFPDDFPGTERFAVRRRLGKGGFGVVYEAFDHRRNAPVALKTLLRFDSSALLRFKKEFRAMADISHPNLISLYDLVAEGDKWFFTMELIDGRNLLEYVRGIAADSDSRPTMDSSIRPTLDESSPEFPSTGMTPRKSSGTRTPGEAATPAPTAANVVLDIDRLRASFAQLAEGVCVLHEAGMLHRDLKPSNVLVTREGRVVLLDFGLVANLDVTEMSTSINIVGTPQYMSPEQSSGHPVTEATDWYSVGIMLYEAITGMPPFAGRFQEMLEKKRFAAPTPPGELVAGLPEDLNALCCELLHREPAARPRGREVARRLGHGLVVVRPAEPAPSAKGSLFMGREQHLAALEDAFQASMQDKSVTVHVHGKSGAGKTSLVHRFLRDLRLREKELVLLTGRCYEQESVPYKALDSVIDDLSVHLKRLPPLEAGRLMPRDVLALARLFPVLREVEAVATTRHKAAEIPNTQELRRRAAAALREILTRMADQGPLVLFIDDLQWGDLDSGVLLNELLRPPDAPSLLLLVTYRSEEATSSPLVQMLLKSRASGAATAEVRELEVAELTSQQAQELAAALLGKHRAASGTRAETIARESGGNPFFLKELARHSAAGGEAGAGETTLEELLRSRYARLPEEARTLLEVIAVAGQPMEIGVASRACGLVAEEHPAVDLLRGNRLVRTRTTVERREIEVYHDRIRQTLVKQLSAETLTAHHHRLAWALKSSGRADPEMLAVHFKGAGDIERAFPYAKLAAGQAAEALAFDRAARLYRLALELQTADKSEERNPPRLFCWPRKAPEKRKGWTCGDAARNSSSSAGTSMKGSRNCTPCWACWA